VIVVTLFMLASCAAETRSPPPDPGADAVSASAIAYDNTLSQLLSTSVQGALDDVAIAGAADRERLDTIEAQLGTTIFCRPGVGSSRCRLSQREASKSRHMKFPSISSDHC
jgi:hypothetical protein